MLLRESATKRGGRDGTHDSRPPRSAVTRRGPGSNSWIPVRGDSTEVGAPDQTITIEVRIAPFTRAPGREQQSEIRGIDPAIPVQITLWNRSGSLEEPSSRFPGEGAVEGWVVTSTLNLPEFRGSTLRT